MFVTGGLISFCSVVGFRVVGFWVVVWVCLIVIVCRLICALGFNSVDLFSCYLIFICGLVRLCL